MVLYFYVCYNKYILIVMEVEMNIEELIILKNDLKRIYEQEKINSIGINNKETYEKELKDIEKEQIKVDKLIEIYQNQNKNNIIMKLERLYMMLLSNKCEKEFNELNENELFEIFDKYFPDEWVYKYNVLQKEQLLLEAICNNKIIKESKKRYLNKENK